MIRGVCGRHDGELHLQIVSVDEGVFVLGERCSGHINIELTKAILRVILRIVLVLVTFIYRCLDVDEWIVLREFRQRLR
jgi:hypothetical protein